jgi:hypothetical protein
MPGNWWESELRLDRRQRDRDEFLRSANHEGFRRAAILRVRELGLDPDTIPALRSDPGPISSPNRSQAPSQETVRRLDQNREAVLRRRGYSVEEMARAGRALQVVDRLSKAIPAIADEFDRMEPHQRLRYAYLADNEIEHMIENEYIGLPVRLLREESLPEALWPGSITASERELGEEPLPGMLGKIPGFRTPGEVGATVATAGFGTTGSIVGRGIQATVGTAAGSLGATGGREVAEEAGVSPWAGELAGGLLGGMVGYGGARGLTTRGPRRNIDEVVKELEDGGLLEVPATRPPARGAPPKAIQDLDLPGSYRSSYDDASPVDPSMMWNRTGPVSIALSLDPDESSLLRVDLIGREEPTLRNLVEVAQELDNILARNPNLTGTRSKVVNRKFVRVLEGLGFSGRPVYSDFEPGKVVGKEFTFSPEQITKLAGGRRAPGGVLGSVDRARQDAARASTEPDLPAPLKLDLGDDTARAVIAAKEDALLSPGKVTQWVASLPGIKQGMGWLNPSVRMHRGVLVGMNARKSVIAALETEFDAVRQPVTRNLQEAWDAETLGYIGPMENPFKWTLKDWADNPDFYTPASPRLKQAASEFDQVSNHILGIIRNQFGVDIGVFKPIKEGAFYTPTVASREAVEEITERLFREAVEGTNVSRWEEPFENTAQRLVRGRSRTRVYEGAYQRWQGAREFAPETSLETTISAHDSSLARMAAWQTFKKSTGGLTKLQAIEATPRGAHLIARRTDVTAKLSSLKGRYQTAKQQLMRLGMTERKLKSLKRGTFRKLDPVYDRIDELGDEYGSELSFLSGEAHQLEGDVRTLDRALKSIGQRKGKIDVASMKSEMNVLKKELDGLRTAYANMEPTGYELHTGTRMYHLAPEIEAMDAALSTSLGKRGDQLAGMIDEIRMTAFAFDASPLTIQGLLGAMADPVVAVRNATKILDQVASGQMIQNIVRNEPDLVRRFTLATGRRFGEAGPEIRIARRGLERVPVVGPAINRRLMGAVEILRYEMWKNDVRLMKAWNPSLTDDVADHEAANTLSKIMPALNMTERGLSTEAARFERLPFISPSFMASPGLMAKDIASGLIKMSARTLPKNPVRAWQSLKGREQLAIMRFVNMAGTAVGASVLSAMISADSRGESIQDSITDVLDPASSNFLSLKLGDQGTVGLGGPFRSFIRGVAPRHVKGELIPFAGLINFGRGKLTPPVAAGVDLVRNRDYLNRPIVRGDFPTNVLHTLWYVTESFIPLSAGSAMEKVRVGETNPAGVGKEMISQLLGTNYREMTAWEQLEMDRDESAYDEYNLSWEEIEPYQRATLEKEHKDKLDRPEARTDRGKAMEDRRQIGVTYTTLQQQSDAALPVGIDWVEEYKRLREQQAGAYDQWERNHPETQGWLDGIGAANPNEQAMNEYRKLFRDARMYSDPNTGEPIGPLNIEQFVLGLNKLEARLTSEQRAYIDRNTGIHDTPRVQEYKRDQETLRPYWEIEEEVWQEMRRDPEWQPYFSLQDFIQVKTQELLDAGTPEDQLQYELGRMPVLTHVGQLISELRFRMRLEKPMIDTALVKWYGMVPAASQTGRGRRRARPSRASR